MTAQDEPQPDLLKSAFALLAEVGLRRLSMVEVARRAGVDAAAVYRELGGRRGLLGALSRRLDEAMLEVEAGDLEGLPPRDRVFELMMARLEAMVPYRDGLERLARDAGGDPCLVLATLCRLDRSLAWLQDAAGLRASGLRARVHRRALGAAYLQTLRVWRRDDAADLGRTMAELDRQLRRVQRFAGLREPRAGGRAAPEEPVPQPA
jgi:AcrR family transcriptional regulator